MANPSPLPPPPDGTDLNTEALVVDLAEHIGVSREEVTRRALQLLEAYAVGGCIVVEPGAADRLWDAVEAHQDAAPALVEAMGRLRLEGERRRSAAS